ncbi:MULTISPECIES: VOC family protein [unclassified Bacillus cereus group]|uniref:VOC family protein n=1 Tax=unclassified Bacillus cereus group TaxID=2750818 RepID=UPI001F5A4708|nr:MULTISPECIES: VOC family protein [unclassified Bacillus cereus group]
MLINRVILYSNALEEMKEFYVRILGFRLLHSNEIRFSIQVGESELEFRKNDLTTKKPFYHFAFNIPSNRFSEAKKWARNKVVLNIEDGVDEIYFPRSHAHSFYFMDPSGNIVEFISRHSISPESNEPFSVHSILNMSEMSLTTNQVLAVGEQLIDFGILVNKKGKLNEEFNFMGESGVYILLGKTGRRWLFSHLNAEVHPLMIEIDREKRVEVTEDGKVSLCKVKNE